MAEARKDKRPVYYGDIGGHRQLVKPPPNEAVIRRLADELSSFVHSESSFLDTRISELRAAGISEEVIGEVLKRIRGFPNELPIRVFTSINIRVFS